MSKFQGCNVQRGDYSEQYCIMHLKDAKRVDLKCSHHTYTHTGNELCEEVEVLTNPNVVIILQYIQIPNHCIAYLKLTQYKYGNYISKKAGENVISPESLPNVPTKWGSPVTFFHILLFSLQHLSIQNECAYSFVYTFPVSPV